MLLVFLLTAAAASGHSIQVAETPPNFPGVLQIQKPKPVRKPAKASSSRSQIKPLPNDVFQELPISNVLSQDFAASVLPPPTPTEGKAASLGRVTTKPEPVSRLDVVRIVLGCLVLLVLAYLGGQPRVRNLENRLGIAQLTTAGIPYILLGTIAANKHVGVLQDPVLVQISPVITFGLGWIGFAIGFRFDILRLQNSPKGTSSLAMALTLLPAVVIAVIAALLLWQSPKTPLFVRDALVIAIAGAITAKSAPSLLESAGASRAEVDRISAIVKLEQLAGIVGLLLLAAYFRPDANSVFWQLPGTAWVFVTVGVGAVVAVVTYILLSGANTGAAFQVVLLGLICFSAGIAAFLRLSAVVVCFIIGAALVNLPSTWKEQVAASLANFERPVYFTFLIIAGALWHGVSWHGWVLMVAFVAARLLGKWAAMAIWRQPQEQALSSTERRGLVVAPMGALSIAIIVSAQNLYSGPSMGSIVTAVVGGSILTEGIIQWAVRSGYLGAAYNNDNLIRY